ncbi:hypothetical protein SELMODRAFT_230318 [Selaginella moellendorffii]|uniref:glucan endo-1,3-beta-D-glucosidase n=1 Tax=Selaginella moellendorffii TaxID=88036 RepID=D8QZC4_SELML|nr:hypothetical protein SELMODRAFT_230318 [Selaginella moellendorffii]
MSSNGPVKGAQAQVGINYGRVANNLPSPSTAVSLIKSLGIDRVKIFDADSQVLAALANTSIKVSIMVRNQDIPGIASNASHADSWVAQNVVHHYPATHIATILVGNEILSDTSIKSSTWPALVPAMENIFASLQARNLTAKIKVSTPLASDALSTSYPPSAGAFHSEIATSVIQPLLAFLAKTGSSYHANVYPYFAYAGNSGQISLEYALFGSGSTVVQDGSLGYRDLLDAMVDSTFAAMERLGYGDIPLVISETGWPSAGDSGQVGASVDNAQLYNARLAKKVASSQGTPKRPGVSIPTYIFALFNENEKSGAGTERNFGIFYPSGSRVYDLNLSGKS